MFNHATNNEVSTTVFVKDIFTNNDKFYNAVTQLKITKVDEQIICIPDKNNEYHGIVSTTITTKNNNSYSGIGESYSSEKIQKEKVLQHAQLIAYKTAVCNALIAGYDTNCNASEVIDIKPTKSYTNYKNQNKKEGVDKSKMNGGGNRGITDKQINFINNIAGEKGHNGDYYANKIWHKNLNQLTGHEADTVIKEIQEEPY